MRRLVPLLVAVLCLGSGCTLFQPPGDLTVAWTFRRTAPAQAGGHLDYYTQLTGHPTSAHGGPCAGANVDRVRILNLTTSTAADFPCVGPDGLQGHVFLQTTGGKYKVKLQGLRGDVVVYEEDASVTVSGNTSLTVKLLGVPAALEVKAALAHGASPGTAYASCAAAGAAQLDFTVRDAHGNAVVAERLACTDPLPAPIIDQAVDLDAYALRVRGFATGQDTPVLDSCWVSLSHLAAQTGAAALRVTLLAEPLPTCPAAPLQD